MGLLIPKNSIVHIFNYDDYEIIKPILYWYGIEFIKPSQDSGFFFNGKYNWDSCTCFLIEDGKYSIVDLIQAEKDYSVIKAKDFVNTNTHHAIFLDDERDPKTISMVETPVNKISTINSYEGFVTHINSLIDLANNDLWPDLISYDYMIGHYNKYGTDCLQLIIDTCIKYGLPMPKTTVHSEYPRVSKKFQDLMDSYCEKTGVEHINIQLIKYRFY